MDDDLLEIDSGCRGRSVMHLVCWQNAHVDSRNGKEINGGGARVKIDCEMAFDRGINTSRHLSVLTVPSRCENTG
jgi:hypothetical protein